MLKTDNDTDLNKGIKSLGNGYYVGNIEDNLLFKQK